MRTILISESSEASFKAAWQASAISRLKLLYDFGRLRTSLAMPPDFE
jgi:hypothetical protein